MSSKYPVGKKNIYTCQSCGGQFVTIDRDPGTTPFMTACYNPRRLGCKGTSQSSFYDVDQTLKPTHEWYRKSDKELNFLRPGMKAHHEMGGLLFLRPITS